MKFQILLLGAFFCLGAAAQGQTTGQSTTQNAKTTQSANRIKRPVASQQSLVGCVDQQGTKYFLRDAKTERLLSLEAPGPDADNYFARFVGHEVNASGTESSGTLKVAQIGQVADMCGTGK